MQNNKARIFNWLVGRSCAPPHIPPRAQRGGERSRIKPAGTEFSATSTK